MKSPFGPARPPSGEVGIRLAKSFTATGGSGNYAWALASGALPAGVVARTRHTRHDRGNAPSVRSLRVRRHRDRQRRARNHIRCGLDGCATAHDQDRPSEVREGRHGVQGKAGHRRRRPAHNVEHRSWQARTWPQVVATRPARSQGSRVRVEASALHLGAGPPWSEVAEVARPARHELRTARGSSARRVPRSMGRDLPESVPYSLEFTAPQTDRHARRGPARAPAARRTKAGAAGTA